MISAVVQSQPNSAAAASIQIPHNDFALQLKPRSLIHLYFYDFYRGAPASDRAWVAGEGVGVDSRDRDPDLEGIIPPERLESTDAQDATDLENQNYRLLFGGELVGVTVDKTPMSRGITLNCLDWSLYWDYAFQYQVQGFSMGGGGGIRAAFTGASTTLFNSFLESNGDIIVGLMSTPPRNFPNLQGTLLGAIVHIIEAMGGVNFGQRAIRGANDFFSIAELRLKLTQMVGANPFEQTNERRLMQANGFGSLFARALSGLGRQVSIRDVLNALQRYIFHEVIPITSPHYIPALVDPNLPQFETTSISANSSYDPIVRAATQMKQRAIDIKTRQASSTDPDTARRLSAQHGGLSVELDRLVALCGRSAQLARRLAVSGGTRFVDNLEIHQIFAVNAVRFQRIKEQTRRGQRSEVRSNTFFPPETPEGQQVDALCIQIEADMNLVLQAQLRRRVTTFNRQPDPPARLLTQIYRPDVWMVAPPRCNVVFPELYSSFSYGRSYMDEVTRLMLRTHSAFFGSDFLFDGYYMAPSRVFGARSGSRVGRGRVGVEPPDLADAPAWFIRDMMDHELYTGIIPKFERMSDLNLHALRGGSVEIDGVRVGYAQLAANHIFFQYRFRSRQLNLQGKFNPFFVLGFPALVIDKYRASEVNDAQAEINLNIANRIASRAAEGEGVAVDSNLPADEQARQREMQGFRLDELVSALTADEPNTHYLGTPNNITHSVSSQTGGSTQVQMTYARSTDERTEFLGDDRVAPARYQRTRNIEVRTSVGCLQPPTTGIVGPRGGEIIEVVDITQQFERAHPVRPVRGRRSTSAVGTTRYTSSSTLPLFIPGGARTGRVRGTMVVIGRAVPAASVPEVAALVGSVGDTQSGFVTSTGTGNEGDDVALTEVSVTFRAYRLKERLGVYQRTTVDLPAEDLTFPPWYGEHYRSQNIGSLYSYFFGTGSIVDPTVILDPRGHSRTASDGGDPSGAAAAPLDTTSSADATDPVTLPEDPTSIPTDPLPMTTGPAGTDAEVESPTTLGEVDPRGTIEEAVATLVETYSQIRRNRFDVDDFLRSYTWRPIASMVDIFGTTNLEIDDDGEVTQGVEGFHSRAFGDFDDLRQLTRTVDGERVATILGLTTTDEDEATTDDASDRAFRDTQRSQRLDTRKEKRLAVFKYVQALLTTRGILG